MLFIVSLLITMVLSQRLVHRAVCQIKIQSEQPPYAPYPCHDGYFCPKPEVILNTPDRLIVSPETIFIIDPILCFNNSRPQFPCYSPHSFENAFYDFPHNALINKSFVGPSKLFFEGCNPTSSFYADYPEPVFDYLLDFYTQFYTLASQYNNYTLATAYFRITSAGKVFLNSTSWYLPGLKMIVYSVRQARKDNVNITYLGRPYITSPKAAFLKHQYYITNETTLNFEHPSYATLSHHYHLFSDPIFNGEIHVIPCRTPRFKIAGDAQHEACRRLPFCTIHTVPIMDGFHYPFLQDWHVDYINNRVEQQYCKKDGVVYNATDCDDYQPYYSPVQSFTGDIMWQTNYDDGTFTFDNPYNVYHNTTWQGFNNLTALAYKALVKQLSVKTAFIDGTFAYSTKLNLTDTVVKITANNISIFIISGIVALFLLFGLIASLVFKSRLHYTNKRYKL